MVEEGDLVPRVAGRLAEIGERLGLRVCFKASYDKANRSRLAAERGPGLDRGLEILARARGESGLPVLTDVHEAEQAAAAAQVADVLQVPAFLCRQTDLLVACGRTGRPVNVKKGQWMQPEGMRGSVEKVRGGGSTEVAVTERGTFFGYGDLVVDFRSVERLREATGAPVIFDATHSVQQPGGQGTSSGGQREFVPVLARAAVAVGVAGVFIETHQDPDKAPSDGPNMIPIRQLEPLLQSLMQFDRLAKAASN